jgi:Flp pilus assembly pilin Flp
MARLLRATKEFFTRDEGASFGEYAVTLVLITAVTLLGIAVLGNAISDFLVKAAKSI